jgi:hypothetical protein
MGQLKIEGEMLTFHAIRAEIASHNADKIRTYVASYNMM